MKIEDICLNKEQELIKKYFGNIHHEAAVEMPETIGDYTKDLPLKIEAEYREFLESVWPEFAPDALKDKPLILDEQQLRRLATDSDLEMIEAAYKDAKTRTLQERILRSNHEDVTYYKGLLLEYTRKLLSIMRLDFLEEITGRHIRNKTFEKD